MKDGVTHFGQVEFDAARGTLLIAGRRVRLDRPSRAILSELIGAAGKDVDKDRLLAVGWPGRVVHENSLAKAISRLREALGADGAALETVHGYGYRLSAGVETAAGPQQGGRRIRDRLRRPALVGAVLGSAAVAALWAGAMAGGMRESEGRGLLRGEPADALGRVLWVDDHPENNVDERRFLEGRKIAVYQATTSEEALALLSMYEYRAVISDMNRSGKPLAGLELVRAMRERGDTTPFVLYTYVPSTAQDELLAEAGGQRATVTPEELYAAVLPLFDEHGTRPSQ